MTDTRTGRRTPVVALLLLSLGLLVGGGLPGPAVAGAGFGGQAGVPVPGGVPAGTGWESRFTGPGLDDGVTAAVEWDDGTGPALYVAGSFRTAGEHRVDRIARWDGVRWSPLTGPDGTGVNGPVSVLAVYDGDLVVGGSFTTAGGVPADHLARWDGERWSPLLGENGGGLSGGTSPGVFALTVHDGELIVGGAFTHADGQVVNHVARWDGERWSPLLGGEVTGVGHSVVPPAVFAVHPYRDGLVVAGRFNQAGGAPAASVAHWDGTDWSALAGGVGGMYVTTVSALATYQGDLLVAGQFPQAGGVTVNNVARFDGTGWSALVGPDAAGTGGTVSTLAVFDGAVIAGGSFTEAGGVTVHKVARFDGTGWSALVGPDGVGVNPDGGTGVHGLLATADRLLVTGRFDTAGGVVANNLAWWDGWDWSALAGPEPVGLGGMTPSVQALATYQGELVVAGGFTRAGAVTAHRIARWDGVRWQPFGSGFDNFQVRALAVYQGQLYAGGQFTTAGGTPVNRIARWDGASWQPLPGPGGEVGVDGEVIAMLVHDGELIVAGAFTRAGGTVVDRIARWDGTSWRPMTAAGGADGQVRSLAAHAGDLIAGGQFRRIGGVAADRIARFDGTRWHPLTGPAGQGLDGQADALVSHADRLYVGGSFHTAGGVASSRVARWDGTGWQALAAGLDNAVMTLAVYDDEVVAGGAFTRSGFTELDRIARWDGTSWRPLAGPAEVGMDDWVTTLLPVEADGRARLLAGGHFVLSGGVANWYLASYGPLGPPPVIEVTPEALAVELTTGEQGTYELSVANVGGGTLDWRVPTTGSPGCDLPDWLAVEPGAGSLAADQRQPVTVTVSATDLSAGRYRAGLCLDSNDPATGRVEVPVQVTVAEPAPVVCDRTVTGAHTGPLAVTDGVTCLAAGAFVLGEVTVADGAGLVATAAVVQGPVSAFGAARVELSFSQVTGPVTVWGSTGPVWLFGNQVTGAVSLVGAATGAPATVAANTVTGSLTCLDNQPPPTDHGLPNTATAGAFGQCAAG